MDVNTEVAVVYDRPLKELRMFTDYGRVSRPLFIVRQVRAWRQCGVQDAVTFAWHKLFCAYCVGKVWSACPDTS